MSDIKALLRHVYEINLKDAEKLVELYKDREDEKESYEMALADLRKWQQKLAETGGEI